MPFLTNWEVLLRGVLQTFVLCQRGIEPIIVVCRQYWFFIHHGFNTMGLLLGFTHTVVVWAVKVEFFLDVRLLMIEMTFLTQQTTTTEMTRPTKSPLPIEKTQLMWWNTTETIWKPTKRCLWTDSVFLLDSLTLTYHSSFPWQTSFVGWIGYSLSWFHQ